MLNINPTLVLIKFMSFICVIWIGAIGIGQIIMIASETTTYETIKGKQTRPPCNCNLHGLQNNKNFLSSGSYRVNSKLMDLSSYHIRSRSDEDIIITYSSMIDRVRKYISRGFTFLKYKLGVTLSKHDKRDEENGLLHSSLQ